MKREKCSITEYKCNTILPCQHCEVAIKFKDGIYSSYIKGVYCEAKFENHKLVDCFVDYYGSDFEMRKEIIPDSIIWRKLD